MDFGIKGKIALVTAASRGLGRGCAEQLAAEGCRVAICARDGNAVALAADEIASRTGATVVGLTADLSRTEEIQALLEGVRRKLGDPQILVTNAGGPPPGTYASTPIEAYAKAFELTLMSAVHLIHGVTPAMQAAGWGRVIAITSSSVKQPIPTLLLSNMARTGLTGFLKTVAGELAPHGITINALLPGTHQTSRIEQLAKHRAAEENKTPEAVIAEIKAANPSGIIGDPMDFGAAAAFLASVQAAYITGQSLLIDGGNCRGLL